MTRNALVATGLMLGAILFAPSSEAVEFPGPKPGVAVARIGGTREKPRSLTLENDALGIGLDFENGRCSALKITSLQSDRRPLTLTPAVFSVGLPDGRSLNASDFRPASGPKLTKLAAKPDSLRLVDRLAGRRVTVPLVSRDGSLTAEWSATLRDQSNYITLQLVLEAAKKPVSIDRVTLLEVSRDEAGHEKPESQGAVNGSPVVSGDYFIACEHPMADNRVEEGAIVCSRRCYLPLEPDRPWTATSVIGVAPSGQMRRAFLYYLQRERARPYGLFLHYNSWWDIAWADRKMNQGQCREVIEIFGRELVEKRGVAIDSFVFDDGWDDNRTLWKFHDGFPQGFAPLRDAAKEYGSSVGTWLSPWGGYGKAKAERLEYGKTQGFETNSKGFSMAGPTYYARFRDVCQEMIDDYGVNYFKFDGIALGIDSDGASPEFAADVEALLRLTGELRVMRPDVYISVTTGTWPSPYWLWYGDSVWRNGHDWNVHGEGTTRQQWITYRDMISYRMIAQRAPLYPLNSLMTVTLCYAQLGTATKMADELPDQIDEIRMAFGSGTQLGELYVTPQMMKPAAWDALAESVRWSRENADVLVDVHFVGGDPGEGEPYGYAAWSPRKGILVLRNPSKSAANLTLDLATALELPAGAAKAFTVASRWARPGRDISLELPITKPHTFHLNPFEILVLEASPIAAK